MVRLASGKEPLAPAKEADMESLNHVESPLDPGVGIAAPPGVSRRTFMMRTAVAGSASADLHVVKKHKLSFAQVAIANEPVRVVDTAWRPGWSSDWLRNERAGARVILLMALLLGALHWPVTHVRTIHHWDVYSANATPDGYEYLRGGESLWAGRGFLSMTGSAQLVFPPLYPLASGAVASVLGNPVLAGRLASFVASAVSVLLFYRLARATVPHVAAVLASLLYVCWPMRLALSSAVMTESLFVALILAGLVSWVHPRPSAWRALLAGVCLGASYLTRPEGLAVFGLLTLTTLPQLLRRASGRGDAVRRTLALSAGFAIAAAPYVLYLHVHCGGWQVSGKAGYNLAIADAMSAGESLSEAFVLNADDRTVVPTASAVSRATTVRRVALAAAWEVGVVAFVASPFLLLAAGLAVRCGQFRGRRWEPHLALAAPLLIAPLFMPASRISPRMMILPGLAVLLVAAAFLGPEAGGTATSAGARAWRIRRALLVGGLAWWALLILGGPLVRRADVVKAEPLLQSVRDTPGLSGPIIGPPGRATGWALAFHTGREFLPLPWAPLSRVERYVRHNQASFVLLSSTDHPELAALAEHPVATPMMRPVASTRTGSRGHEVVMRLFRVEWTVPASVQSPGRRAGRVPSRILPALWTDGRPGRAGDGRPTPACYQQLTPKRPRGGPREPQNRKRSPGLRVSPGTHSMTTSNRLPVLRTRSWPG
jgi:hypothetical protein